MARPRKALGGIGPWQRCWYRTRLRACRDGLLWLRMPGKGENTFLGAQEAQQHCSAWYGLALRMPGLGWTLRGHHRCPQVPEQQLLEPRGAVGVPAVLGVTEQSLEHPKSPSRDDGSLSSLDFAHRGPCSLPAPGALHR